MDAKIEVTQADREAVLREAYGKLWRSEFILGIPQIVSFNQAVKSVAQVRLATEAAFKAREAELVEAGNAMRNRLMAFVSVLALQTDCGPDVDAMKAWERLTRANATPDEKGEGA